MGNTLISRPRLLSVPVVVEQFVTIIKLQVDLELHLHTATVRQASSQPLSLIPGLLVMSLELVIRLYPSLLAFSLFCFQAS